MNKLSLFLSLCLMQPVHAAWWIDALQQPARIHIQRGDAQLPARLLMPLQSGDLLHLSDTAQAVLLHEKQRLTLSAADSPYTIPATAPPPTLLDNILYTLSTWFSEKMSQPAVLVTLASRGDTPQLRGIYLQPLQLQAGRTRLSLYWQDGAPPYHLSLQRADGSVLAQRDNLQATQATLEFAPLPVGDYRLILSGGGTLTLSVQATQTLPPNAQALLAQTDIPPTVRDRYLALMLAELPAWRVESWQLFEQHGLHNALWGMLNDKDSP